jgi:RNA polymerase primary sigma factor
LSLHNDDIDQYMAEIGRFPLLTEKEERSLARRIAKGDEDARERLISCNLRLVVTIAKYYSQQTAGLGLGDLINEGNLGLIKAAARFNPRRGGRFSTYGSFWIRQAIRRAVIDKSRTVRVPAYMADILTQWRRAHAELSQSLGREPSQEEIADRCKVPYSKIKDVRKAMTSGAFTGRDSEEGDDDDMVSLGEYAAAHQQEAAPPVLVFDLKRERVDATLEACLGERERLLLKMRYGLGEFRSPMTLDAVGLRLQLTRERVRQIEMQALEKLQVFLLGRGE